MKKLRKQLLCFVLAFIFAFAFGTAAQVGADGVITGTVEEYGSFLPWRLYSNGVLALDGGNINRGEFSVNSPWHEHRANIREIVFTEEVIGGQRLNALFAGLSQLKTIEGLSYLDTSSAVNMRLMFVDATALTSLDLSHFDTENVTDMSRMFEGAADLTTLDLSSFNTKNTTNMSHMFRIASRLTSVNLSNFNTANVTNMEAMFWGTISLTTLDLGCFDTGAVTNMRNMFSYSTRLESLNLSGFDTRRVSDMSGMFNNTTSLRKITLGRYFNFRPDVLLPSLQSSYTYTGRWQSLGPASLGITFNSEQLTDPLNTHFAAGATWVWQRNPCLDGDGHNPGEWEEILLPNCREQGKAAIICLDCANVLDRKYLPPRHNVPEWKTTIEPTCTVPGSENGYCKSCSQDIIQPIPALDHDMADAPAINATCTKDGRTAGQYCARYGCDHTVGMEVVSSSGHDIRRGRVLNHPTCVAGGREVWACVRDGCNQYDVRAVPPLNHALQNVTAVTATCTAPGRTVGVRCVRAGCTHTTSRSLAALGHTRLSVNARAATFFRAGRTADVVCGRAGCNHTHSRGRAIAVRRLARPNITLRATGNRRVRVTSRRVAGANRYRFQFRRRGQRTWRNSGIVRNRARNIRGLTRGQRYQFRVRAVRIQGGQRANSNWSVVRNIRVR